MIQHILRSEEYFNILTCNIFWISNIFIEQDTASQYILETKSFQLLSEYDKRINLELQDFIRRVG